MKNNLMKNKIEILDWGIILSFLILLLIIYVPNSIWKEEAVYRNESRARMEIIADAEEFFKELTGKYTKNGKLLFKLVSAAIDSAIADTLFLGEQTIFLNDTSIRINMNKSFLKRADTTFSIGVPMKRTIKDTIYSIGMLNNNLGMIDTVFVNSKGFMISKEDTLFQNIFSIDTTSYSEFYTDYLKNIFKLTFDLLQCPLTKQFYILEINSSDPEYEEFIIKSPVPFDYAERRYLFFKFTSGIHGSIIDKQKSWSKN